MSKLEKLALQIFNECQEDGEPVTMEEATEMAKMEIGAKDVKLYAHSENADGEPKTRAKRTTKVSEEKSTLFNIIKDMLQEQFGDNATVIKDNKEINVIINDKQFKVDLIEHRKSKQ